MQGILDNPDAAYAKLKEMGKGLFGPEWRRARRLWAGCSAAARVAPARRAATRRKAAAPTARPLGGQLGETIGNLLQQGLSGGLAPERRGASRSQSRKPTRKPGPQPSAGPGRCPAGPARARAERNGRAAGQPANERRAAAAVQPLSRHDGRG